jgi:Domain of unknown function (DUF4266)
MTIMQRPTLVALLAGTALLAGCSSFTLPSMPEPWVKPYERERLADPIMRSGGDPLAARHREHVLVVREASRGANAAQGGGCGCN